MARIALVRARYARGFIAALGRHGALPQRYLERAHLPVELIDDADQPIAAPSLWCFAAEAARDTGIRDLGLLAGSTPIDEHGAFGSRVAYQPNLYHAIQTFCREARAEYSEADFYLTRDAETAWFCRGPIAGDAESAQQVELYVLMLMLQVIRSALGQDWQPGVLHLQNEDARGLADAALLPNANLMFGARRTAIALPVTALTKPLPSGRTTSPLHASTRQAAGGGLIDSDDPVAVLRYLVSSRLGIAPPTIKVTAEAAGMSVRTLQRLLNHEGLSYSGLVDEVRLQSAVPLLEVPSTSVTDIALELGYSDVAHFSRAFKRWTGISPQEYRRRTLV